MVTGTSWLPRITLDERTACASNHWQGYPHRQEVRWAVSAADEAWRHSFCEGDARMLVEASRLFGWQRSNH